MSNASIWRDIVNTNATFTPAMLAAWNGTSWIHMALIASGRGPFGEPVGSNGAPPADVVKAGVELLGKALDAFVDLMKHEFESLPQVRDAMPIPENREETAALLREVLDSVEEVGIEEAIKFGLERLGELGVNKLMRGDSYAALRHYAVWLAGYEVIQCLERDEEITDEMLTALINRVPSPVPLDRETSIRSQLSYVAADGKPLTCSKCDRQKDVLCRVPVLGETRGAPVDQHDDAWVGLCKNCLTAMVSGFERAEQEYAKNIICEHTDDIVAWKRRSEAGECCGVLDCQNAPTVKCQHGCLNHYCDEHVKIHSHVVGSDGSVSVGPHADDMGSQSDGYMIPAPSPEEGVDVVALDDFVPFNPLDSRSRVEPKSVGLLRSLDEVRKLVARRNTLHMENEANEKHNEPLTSQDRWGYVAYVQDGCDVTSVECHKTQNEARACAVSKCAGAAMFAGNLDWYPMPDGVLWAHDDGNVALSQALLEAWNAAMVGGLVPRQEP
jgi:hypothetical protein